MAKDNKVRMPSSTAGITSFSESETSKFIIRPGSVVVICAVVFLITILLHLFGSSLLGVQ